MDLDLLPIARLAGQDRPSLPGLYHSNPPRRTARGRHQDRLILYLVVETGMAGAAGGLPAEQLDKLLASAANRYYQSAGSTTAALRAAAEELNQALLERNLRAQGAGSQLTGHLAALAVRSEGIFIAQSGALPVFWLSAEDPQRLEEAAGAGRGLGLARAVSLRMNAISPAKGDILLLAHEPPASVSGGSLGGLRQMGLASLRRYLLNESGAEFSGVLLQTKPGPGTLTVLRPKAAAPGMAQAAPPLMPQPAGPAAPPVVQAQAQAEPQALPGASLPVEALPQPAAPEEAESDDEQAPWEAADFETLADAAAQPAPFQPQPAGPTPAPPPPAQPADPVRRPRRQSLRPAGPGWLSRLEAALGPAAQSVAGGLGTLLRRVLPDESLLNIPGGAMAAAAVIIPVVVVTVSLVIYLQRGRTAQQQALVADAQSAAETALAQTDPLAQRQAWTATLELARRADDYLPSVESQALRQQAQNALDLIDEIVRLNYQPAIVGGLAAEANIIQMAATENDLFLLDGRDGRALHAFFAGRGYEINPQFNCASRLPTTPTLGPLVDIAVLPRGLENDLVLVGLDSAGNLARCTPGEEPQVIALTPPEAGWKNPTAISAGLDALYVLEPEQNAVWVYWGWQLETRPDLFFAEQVPPMAGAIDLAVDGDDLYLLHRDGHMTLCTFSSLQVSPTRCTDPAVYLDDRLGREGQPLLTAAAFRKVYASQPPDPSLYLLEPGARSIYHLSLRQLTFQRVLSPLPEARVGLPSAPATAFALTPDNRVAILALGNEVVYANIP